MTNGRGTDGRIEGPALFGAIAAASTGRIPALLIAGFLAASLSALAQKNPASDYAADSPAATPVLDKNLADQSPLLVILAPIQKAQGYLIRGFPEQVYSRLVEIRQSESPVLPEEKWLLAHGVEYSPSQRDPVIAPDYNPTEATTRIVYHLDRITSGTPTNVIPLTIDGGQAFVRGLTPGPYCLLIPSNPPLSTTVIFTEPVTIVRATAWEPLLFQFYLAMGPRLDRESLRAALSPAPFAQVSPLIERIRSTTSLSPVELYLFYRGYYEALALARWAETSPDGRLPDFLQKLRIGDSAIDQLINEALMQQELVTDIRPGPGPTGPATPTPTAPDGGPGVAWADQGRAEPFQPGLAHYRSFYHVGMAVFFLTEANEQIIPASTGQFIYPEEKEIYAEQYRYLARQSYRMARASTPDNPLLPMVQSLLEGRLTP